MAPSEQDCTTNEATTGPAIASESGNSNDVAEPAWRIHQRMRELLQLSDKQYAQHACMRLRSVTGLENPNRINTNRKHIVAEHSTVAFLRQQANALDSNELHGLIDKYVASLAAIYKFRSMRILVTKRIETGTDFDEKTGLKSSSVIFNRIQNDIAPPFKDLVASTRGTTFANDSNKQSNTPEVWNEPEIQENLAAYLADQCEFEGYNKPLALLIAATEFAFGDSFESTLRTKLGLSEPSAKAIVRKELIPTNTIVNVIATLEPFIGPAAATELLALWEPAYSRSIATLKPADRIQQEVRNQNLQRNYDLVLKWCQAKASKKGEPSRDIEQALFHKVIKKVSISELWHIVAPNWTYLYIGMEDSRQEWIQRRKSYTKSASQTISPELHLWGLQKKQLGYNEETTRNLTAATGEKSVTEEEILRHTRDVGRSQRSLPTVRRCVADKEPTSLIRMLEIFVEKTGRGKLAEDANLQYSTLNKVLNGEKHLPLCTITHLCKAANVREVPSTVAIECLLNYGAAIHEECQEKNQHHLWGAVQTLGSYTHRSNRALLKDKKSTMKFPESSYMNQILPTIKKSGRVNENHLEDYLKAVNVGKNSPCEVYVRALMAHDSVPDALQAWFKQMIDQKEWKVLYAMRDLLSFVEPAPPATSQSSPSSKQPSDNENIMREYRHLLNRKFVLDRWKSNLPALSPSQRVDTPAQNRALKVLKMLPGVTAPQLLTLKGPLQEVKFPQSASASEESKSVTHRFEKQEAFYRRITESWESASASCCPLLTTKEEAALARHCSLARNVMEGEVSDIVEAACAINLKKETGDGPWTGLMAIVKKEVLKETQDTHIQLAPPDETAAALAGLKELIVQIGKQPDIKTLTWTDMDSPELTLIHNLMQALRHLTLLSKKITSIDDPAAGKLVSLAQKVARMCIQRLDKNDPLRPHVDSIEEELTTSIRTDPDCGPYVNEALNRGIISEVSFDTAKQLFTSANLRLVCEMTKKYGNKGNFDDLAKYGVLGLMRAIADFDHTLGTRFSTLAAVNIKRAILANLQKQYLVQLPEDTVALINKYRDVECNLGDELGREPTRDEVLDKMEVSGSTRRSIVKALDSIPASLNLEDEHGKPLIDPADTSAPSAAAEVERADSIAMLRRVLEENTVLNPEESEIITLRFGLTDEDPKTLREIAGQLGCSYEKVRQTEASALQKLASRLSSESGEDI